MSGFIRSTISPQAMGVSTYPARRLALESSTGATDFGEYFTYFSFFLVVSALMLAMLFFRLGIEGRLRQIGILRASGFTIAHVRRLLTAEALVLSILGSAAGVLGALVYAHVIVYGLRTWWIGAVGTTALVVHADPVTLGGGAVSGVLAALLCVVLALRAVARRSPRALLGRAVHRFRVARYDRCTSAVPAGRRLLRCRRAAAHCDASALRVMVALPGIEGDLGRRRRCGQAWISRGGIPSRPPRLLRGAHRVGRRHHRRS